MISNTFILVILVFALPVAISFYSDIVAGLYIEGWITFASYLVYLEKDNLMMCIIPFVFLQFYLPLNFYLSKSIKESL